MTFIPDNLSVRNSLKQTSISSSSVSRILIRHFTNGSSYWKKEKIYIPPPLGDGMEKLGKLTPTGMPTVSLFVIQRMP